MMFAKNLKPGQPVKVTPSDGGEILHLSQVCMVKPSDSGRTYLKIINGNESFACCVLQKDKQECCSVDLFINTREGVQLAAEGAKNDLSVIGYFEPDNEDDSNEGGEGLGFTDSEEEEEEEEASDDDTDGMSAPVVKDGRIEDLDAMEEEAKKKKGTNKKAQAVKALQAAAANDDDEDDDDDDGEEDDDDEGEEDDDDEEEEADESEPEPPVDNKRKQQQQQQQQQQGSKKAKTDTKDEKEYRNSLIEFLKKNGPTPLASLGQKVKKPQNINIKMAAFLKNNSNVFSVEGGKCSLK